MSLSIGSLIIADASIQNLAFRSVLGGYELIFILDLTVHPEREIARKASIIGARVSFKVGGNGPHTCGFARPEGPFEIRQYDHPSSMTPSLILPLHPGQLAAIEDIRGAGDLDFELLMTGIGTDQHGEQQVQDTLRFHTPRSDWIKKLKDAKARDILLLEVPLPLRNIPKKWVEAAKSLKSAEQHYRNGDYHACVASCRTVVHEIGYQKFKKKDWSGALLNRLSNDRNSMTKDEREAALWGTLRHYTHQAHHSDSEGGFSNYTRADAQLILTLTSSFLAHIQAS